MLDTETKRRIDSCRDILVGKVPDPKSQVEQITIALIYKFMSDMDTEAVELGGKRTFFSGDYRKYEWPQLMAPGMGGHDMLHLYSEAITQMSQNTGLPELFRDIFKNAYLPYRDPETLRAFLKEINTFSYDHSERLGDAFEYLLSVLGSQGDAGQFRTPRHIIDFMVEVIDPKKEDSILDPACGTAGFLISSYKHIVRKNTSQPSPPAPLPKEEGGGHYRGGYNFSGLKKRARELRKKQTDAEEFLWEFLRNRQCCGVKFRRQHQFGDYICDFYCHTAGLVVECDGEVHASEKQQKKDQRRSAYLKSQGLTVIRFQNDRVLKDIATVLEEIIQKLPSPAGRGGGGEGKPGHEHKLAPMRGDLLTPDDKKRLVRNIRGYDISPDMVRLSLVNLYLHGFTEPHIVEYDTLTSEEKWNEQADIILANPPFMSPKGGIKPHKRFSVQAKRAEVLFVDYIAEHLMPTGRAAIIVPEGIIFQSGKAYKQLRKNLVETAGLVAVVSLPAGVFQPYSGVKTSILILDRRLAKQRDDVLFVKIENDGYGLGAQRRAVLGEQLSEAKQVLKEFFRQDLQNGQDWGKLAHAVSREKIAENGEYNLSGERYKTVEALSSDYPFFPIGELCIIERGASPRPIRKFVTDSSDGVNWIKIGDAKVGSKYITKTKEKITLEGARKSRAVKSGDFILSNSMSFGRPYVMATDGCIHDGWLLLRDTSENLNRDYLYLILGSEAVFAQFKRLATGGVVNNLNSEIVRGVQIPLPPLSVQEELVLEIEGYQKIIDGARAVLDHYRPHIPIHPDWPMVVLEEVCKTSSGGTPLKKNSAFYDGGTIPWLRSGEVGQGEVFRSELFITEEGLKNSSAKMFSINTVLVAMYGATAGEVGILRFEASTNQAVCGITPDGRLSPDFLYLILKVNKSELIRLAGGGAQPNISQKIIREQKIPLPPLAEQEAIVTEIEAEQALVDGNRELITRFETKIQQTIARVWGE